MKSVRECIDAGFYKIGLLELLFVGLPASIRLPIPIFNFGGKRGIRTLESLAALHAFQACRFSLSRIFP